LKPITIKIVNNEKLLVKWDDGLEQLSTLQKIRRLCPCATCMADKEKESPTYIPLFTFDQSQIKEINVVGSYAISISWKDGHNTGIYEFPFLRKICSE